MNGSEDLTRCPAVNRKDRKAKKRLFGRNIPDRLVDGVRIRFHLYARYHECGDVSVLVFRIAFFSRLRLLRF